MVKREGLPKYEGSLNRDITSVNYDEWTWSFVISKAISIHLELSIAFSSKP